MAEGMDRAGFARCLMELAVAFDRDVSDPKADLMWDRMRDIPMEYIEQAATRIINEQKRFPSIAVWRETCDEVAKKSVARTQDASRTLPVAENEYYCIACLDTGWEGYDVPTPACYGPEYAAAHPTFRRVRRCSCWEHNPHHVRPLPQFYNGGSKTTRERDAR